VDGLLKQRTKQTVRRLVGEPYVGKRLKQIRLGIVLEQLELAPTAILDAGTEDATFVYWLAHRYPRAFVTAVDIDEAAIADCIAARPARYRNRIDFRVATFAELPAASYDLITIFDVLEHIDDDGGAVRELARALRPGGTLLAHVPRNRWKTWHGEIKVVPDHEAWKINPGHVRMGYSPSQLRSLLASGGLEVNDVQTWLGRWGVLAHEIYGRLEHPAPFRILSIPATVAAARIESRQPFEDGNTVFARAIKRA
jgi:SAM-dependent methyltransferase